MVLDARIGFWPELPDLAKIGAGFAPSKRALDVGAVKVPRIADAAFRRRLDRADISWLAQARDRHRGGGGTVRGHD